MGLWQVAEVHDQLFEDLEGTKEHEAMINSRLSVVQ
jgi:hypothetical protein